MSTFQDQPPQSRRAARMVEREREARDPAAVAEATGEQPGVGSEQARAIVNDAVFPQSSWARTGEVPSWSPGAAAQPPVPQSQPAPAQRAPAAPAPTRRRDLRQPTDGQGGTGEAPTVGTGPSPFSTTGPGAFTRTGPGAFSTTGPAVPAAQSAAPQPPIAQQPTAQPSFAPQPAAQPTSPAPASVFAAPAPGAAPIWAAAAPSAPTAHPADDADVERTLSRRELRALRDHSATESDTVTNPMPSDAPVAAAPQAAPFAQASAPVAPPSPAFAPPVAAPAAQASAPAAQPSAPVAAASGAPSTWSAPEGHWTRQLDDDTEEPFETTLSREVGISSPTTSALVLPDLPSLDLSGPLNSTGEIMLTGSIRLPDSYARTGASEHVDLRDDLTDIDDERGMDVPADSRPIRAVAAVTGQHALGTPIVSTVKPGRGNRALTALLIAASSLAVVVTGLIIAAFAFGMI